MSVQVSWNREGVEFHTPESEPSSELALLLGQLEDEGYTTQADGQVNLPWPAFYKLASSTDHRESVGLMGLPPIEAWRPSLASRGTLTDTDFSVAINGWVDPDGRRPMGNVDIAGAVITAGKRSSILSESVWRIVEAVAAIRSRPASARGADANRRAWADIRSNAASAGADMSDFLRKTVVLTPERLRIDMRKSDVVDGKMVEVLPGFDGAPPRWLEIFDRMPGVPERYEIPDGQGIVHVLVSPEVRTVLQEVRRMPGRRVAGERAEAFGEKSFRGAGAGRFQGDRRRTVREGA